MRSPRRLAIPVVATRWRGARTRIPAGVRRAPQSPHPARSAPGRSSRAAR